MQQAIPLTQQVAYFREYKTKLAQVAGSSNASSIISGALYIVSAGASDFVQNYYINPYHYKTQSPDDFSTAIIDIFTNFIKVLDF